MANQNTALATIESTAADIEKILETCNVVALKEMTGLVQTIKLAAGIQQLRAALTDEVMVRVFMPLQSSPLGFLTDKDQHPKEWNEYTPEQKREWKPGYPLAVVREVVIETLINGLRPIGNEINIISRRMYAAKNGVMRKLSEFPGLSDLVIVPGAPVINEKNEARIAIHATWKVNGVPFSMIRDVEKRADGTASDTRFSIRVNFGMGADAIIGKATRKIYKAILDQLTGSALSLPDGDVLDTIGEEIAQGPAPSPAPPEQDGKRMKVGAKPAEPVDSPPAKPMREPDPDSDGR
jgi:hypothetical protein